MGHILNQCICLILYFSTCTTQFITVYEEENFRGPEENINISDCSNLPRHMRRNVLSVDTQNNCVRLYDGLNCNGNHIEILSRSPSHSKLAAWSFADKTESAGKCPDSCSTEVTGRVFDKVVEVQLFKLKDYKGTSWETSVNGCVKVPDNFVNHTFSVRTFDNCIQLYNNPNCETNGTDVDTIEMRTGTPYHNDTTRWHFPTVKSISRCSHKCNSKNESLQMPEEGEVYLFNAINFGGEFHKLSISTKDCINLPLDWNGMIESYKISNKTCIKLFDRIECRGEYFSGKQSISDLSTVDFNKRTRSIRSCTDKYIPELENFSNVTSQPDLERNMSGNFNSNHYFAGNQKFRQEKPENANSFSALPITVLVVVPVVAALASLVVVLFVLKRCHPNRNMLDRLSEKEIQEFLSGIGMDMLSNGCGNTCKPNEYSTELLAQNKAFNSEYEIPRSNIQIDLGTPLGSGEFGTVYKGTVTMNAQNENMDMLASNITKVAVAIKTVNSSAGSHGLRSLLKEVKVMLFLGPHTNIARFIGCCTDKIRQGNIWVLMEFCSGGSLESHLVKNRPSFVNIVQKGHIYRDNKSTTGSNEILLSNTACHPAFDIFRIFQWCGEIASGMEFLSKANVVHSDLASRNILLDGQLQAKISDFGLSRQLYSYSQYMKKQREPLPWRWMALESLKALEFSTKSDVWSYGILCWEMLTLGDKPYSGLAWNETFISNLESGLRPSKPKNATNDFFNLMLRCWEEDPGRRPSFKEIIEDIQEMIMEFTDLPLPPSDF